MPWELKLVRMRDGQYQLRALVPQEINDRKGNPRNALGGTDLEFSGNIFELPDARGNNFVLEGIADIALASAFRFEVGSSNMRYIPESNSYIVARVHDIKYNQKAQADTIKDVIMWRAFVDTYSTEIQINDGEAVIFMGDSYLHPDQPIRVGGVGPVRVRYMFRMPILRYTVKERGDIAVFRSTKPWEKWPYVKRVIGLPGDKIALRDGLLFINGKQVYRTEAGGWQAEDNNGHLHIYYQYVEELPNGVRHKIIEIDDHHRLDNFEEITVPEGYLFFMGDNRDESEDSRGDLGLIPFENIIGRVRGRN